MLPSLAWAGVDTYAQCQFDTECLAGEACAATDYQMTIVHDDTFGFIMQTVAENIQGYVFDKVTPDVEGTLIARTKTTGHILIIQPDGAAGYSVHMQGEMLISYTGKCEVTQ